MVQTINTKEPDRFHIKRSMEPAISVAKDIVEIKEAVLDILRTARHQSLPCRLGYVSLAIPSNSMAYTSSMEIADHALSHVRWISQRDHKKDFPLFSLTDIFDPGRKNIIFRLGLTHAGLTSFFNSLLREPELVTDLFLPTNWQQSKNTKLDYGIAQSKGMAICTYGFGKNGTIEIATVASAPEIGLNINKATPRQISSK